MNIFKYIIVGLVSIVAFIALAGIFKFDFLANLPEHTVDGNKIKSEDTTAVQDNGDENKSTYEFTHVVQQSPNRVKSLMSVKIPELKFTENDFVIEYSQYEVEKSPQVLNATYKKLFDLRSEYKDKKWNGLSFSFVSIDSKGQAIVRLKGQWHGFGDMSSLYFKREIEAAAFQYPSVKSIKVLQDGKIFDWCVDDMRGGPCNASENAWIKEK